MAKKQEPLVDHDAGLAASVQKQMLSEKYLSGLSSFFKVIGDPTRVKIIYALANQEMCVNDLAMVLGMTQSAVSHQLKLLKMENQVKSRREGKNIYYSLDDQHVVEILEAALCHVQHKLKERK